jgi:hypothetical protein
MFQVQRYSVSALCCLPGVTHSVTSIALATIKEEALRGPRTAVTLDTPDAQNAE